LGAEARRGKGRQRATKKRLSFNDPIQLKG
jgi:hypothetical protein